MYNERIIDLFDFKSKLLDKQSQKDIKIKFSPFFVYIEHIFRQSFGTNNIDKEIIISPKFKQQYVYLSERYSVEEIEHLIKLVQSCRNTLCHLLVRTQQNNKLILSPDSLLCDLNFFEDTVCEIDGQLTLQGMFSLVMLFLSNEAANDFIDLISCCDELKTKIKFYKSKKENGIKAEENAFQIKNKLKKDFKNYCRYSYIKNSCNDKNFFEFYFSSKTIARFVLDFENLAYDFWDVKFCGAYSTFKEGLSKTKESSSETKDLIQEIRNDWAHGKLFDNLQSEEQEIIPRLIDLFRILIRDFVNSKEVSEFLRRHVDKFSSSFYNFKYKRLVELIVKISHPEEYEPKKRIKAIAELEFTDIMSVKNEQKLWHLKSSKNVVFDFKHKFKKIPSITLNRIDIYRYEIGEDYVAIINDVEINSKSTIILASIDGCNLPDIKFTNNGKFFSWKENFVVDYGFAVVHNCSIA